MGQQIGPVGSLSAEQASLVLGAAIQAPSRHNSQPWRFGYSRSEFSLFADTTRTLAAADPDHRELLLACGAALLNLRLAIRAQDVHADVRLCPDPRNRDLLAVVRPEGHSPIAPADRRVAHAIPSRRTNRRPFSDGVITEPVRHALRQAAEREQSWLAILSTSQLPTMRELVRQAHHVQLADPHFQAEWSRWTGPDSESPDGVPATQAGPSPKPRDPWVLRDFSGGQGWWRVPGKDFEERPLIAVVGSFHDLPIARLQAGQAMQRVLLTATTHGLSASFLSQVVEVPAVRRQVRELIGGGLWPQTVLRIASGSPVAPTPRRALHEVVELGNPASC
jgi:nitroreductase